MRDFQRPGRSTVHSLNGMAATSHPLATLTAIERLKAGGTAADAAIAAAAVLAVVEPQSTGIGGDCFVLYAPGGGDKIIAYNGSGQAPKAATAEWYLDHGMKAIPITGPHSVTVPGAIDAWSTLLTEHGRGGFDEVLQPAIKAASDGYVVAPRIARDWKKNLPKLQQGTNTPQYLLPGGKAPAAGDVIRQTELAETLRTIAREGRDGFYKGRVAADIVETLRAVGGLHTVEDFAAHRTEITTPLKTSYRGHTVWQCPPNGPGLTMLLMLNILEGFDLKKYGPLSVERMHLEAEAARFAYQQREAHVGDPRFVKVDVERLLSPAFAEEIRRKISLERMADLPVVRPPAHPSTIYLTVVDKDRNVCSFINSLAYGFGSAVVSNKTGVLLQNRGAGFRVEPGHPNCIAPGKRPLHTIIPSMMTKDGKVVMGFGVMGGQYQPVGQTHVTTNILDYGMDLQEAIDLARGFHYEGVYQLEGGIPEETLNGLAALGHKVVRHPDPLGGGQAIWIDWEKGTLTGASEPRKDGCALGY